MTDRKKITLTLEAELYDQVKALRRADPEVTASGLLASAIRLEVSRREAHDPKATALRELRHACRQVESAQDALDDAIDHARSVGVAENVIKHTIGKES